MCHCFKEPQSISLFPEHTNSLPSYQPRNVRKKGHWLEACSSEALCLWGASIFHTNSWEITGGLVSTAYALFLKHHFTARKELLRQEMVFVKIQLEFS